MPALASLPIDIARKEIVPVSNKLCLDKLTVALESQQFATNISADAQLDCDLAFDLLESVSRLLERHHALAVQVGDSHLDGLLPLTRFHCNLHTCVGH